MGEVVLARTSPTLHPPIPSHCASIVATSTLRVNAGHSPLTQWNLVLHNCVQHGLFTPNIRMKERSMTDPIWQYADEKLGRLFHVVFCLNPIKKLSLKTSALQHFQLDA